MVILNPLFFSVTWHSVIWVSSHIFGLFLLLLHLCLSLLLLLALVFLSLLNETPWGKAPGDVRRAQTTPPLQRMNMNLTIAWLNINAPTIQEPCTALESRLLTRFGLRPEAETLKGRHTRVTISRTGRLIVQRLPGNKSWSKRDSYTLSTILTVDWYLT